jgi:hypothetical protein
VVVMKSSIFWDMKLCSASTLHNNRSENLKYFSMGRLLLIDRVKDSRSYGSRRPDSSVPFPSSSGAGTKQPSSFPTVPAPYKI